MGLSYVHLDLASAKLVLFTDASFANARGLTSQLGYVILMVDKDCRANVIHYGSSRCHRVTRSVLSSELHALVQGFDIAYVLQHLFAELMDRRLEIEAYVDSRSVFDVVAKQGKTA